LCDGGHFDYNMQVTSLLKTVHNSVLHVHLTTLVENTLKTEPVWRRSVLQ